MPRYTVERQYRWTVVAENEAEAIDIAVLSDPDDDTLFINETGETDATE